MKARIFVLAGLLAVSCAALAQGEAPRADAITGVWKTKSGGYIQIYDTGDSYAGKIVGSVDGQPRYDTENPDPDKRGRRLLGVTLLHGLEYEGDLTWGDGEIYAPDSGETYSAQATLIAPDKLEVRGYIGISLFGRSQIWTSVPLDAPNLENDLLVGKPGQANPPTTETNAGGDTAKAR